MPELMESVAVELRNRIGQVVSQYEVDVALLKTQHRQQLEEKDAEITALREEVNALKAEKEDSVPEENPEPTTTVTKSA